MAALFKPSCVKCSRYLSCKDKLKNTRGHSCVEFKRLREIHDVSELEHIALVPKGEDEDLVKPLKRAKIIVPAEPEIEVADNFVLQAMERAYDPNTNLVRDLKIDDGDLPLAKNFYDYCANLAGKNVKMPFSRQLWIGLTLCGEICPDCTNPKAQEMWNVPVDLDPHDLAASMSLLEYGVCPDCKKTKYDFIKEGTLKDYSELVLVGGQRMGKSTFTASLVAYCTHRLFKAPKLSTISRGIQDFTPLTASFVALTATKAQKLLWNPVRDLIGASEWFTDYFKMLDHFGKKYGKEFYQFNSTGTYLRAFHKNLDMYPEGPSKRTLRGPTRWLCIAKGSLVNTDKGLVPIESVRAGLHRTNVGNEWTDVTKTGCMGVKQCLQLETASGAQVILTPDHRVLTYCPDQRSLVWEEAQLVPLGGYLVRSVPEKIEDSSEPATRIIPGRFPHARHPWTSTVGLTLSCLNHDRVSLPTDVEHALVDRGIVLDRLVSVKPAGLHEVYDIEVKSKLHAFTVQGLVVHNCATDELGHFPYSTTAGDEDEEEDERERANGDEVHQVLTNSLATVRTEVGSMYARGIFTVPQGFNLSISSPASFKDKIMRLYRETQDSDLALGVKAATWEISPLYSRDHPIIQDMYRRNPRKAERDFGANPPSLDSSIFNKELVLPLFQEDRVLSIVYVDHHEKTRAKAVVVKEQATLHPAILALDAGLTNNAFALSLTYKDQTTGLVTGRSSLEIVPQPGKKIDFPYVYENVIKVIIATQNVKWVFADRWNSIHILQQIETDFPGVKATQYSLKAKDFANFIEVVGDRKISLGALEIEVDRIEAVIDYKKELKNYPNAHLFLQFLTVQLQGGMLYKGGSNTDDLMRALVLGVSRQYDAKVSEHMAKFKVHDREGVSTNAVVLVSGRSGLGYFNR